MTSAEMTSDDQCRLHDNAKRHHLNIKLKHSTRLTGSRSARVCFFV